MFGIRDSAALRRRFMIYSQRHGNGARPAGGASARSAVVVQELGGFLSVIACFYAARKRGIRNWFIEPSFFRGRLYFTPDSFAAPDTMATPAEPVSAEVRAYLDETLRQRAIVIPQKDRHQYSAAFKQDRQRPQRPPPRRKALGPVRARQASGIRSQSPPCAGARGDGARRDAAAESSIARCRKRRSSIIPCTFRPTWR